MPWRHAVVATFVAGGALLAGLGVIGAGDDGVLRAERFDAKQVTVSPAGDGGVRVREVVDIDFGVHERRGYQRIIPNDFGIPSDIVASSPDANSEVNSIQSFGDTRIRVGNPNVTFTGKHRYILEYTLPDAEPTPDQLALDIIGTDETFETKRFDIVLTGFDFTDTFCDTGRDNAFGGCEFTRDESGNYTAVVEPLEAGHGITVGGHFAALTSPIAVADPPLPDPIPGGFRPLGWLMIPLGLISAGGVFWLSRWYGSNEVFAGGAAEAAFGTLPTPREGDPSADVPTYRVPDSRLAELATIEFVPPRGLEPWQGSVLLREKIDDDTVSAWFSEMIARDAIFVRNEGKKVYLEPGTETVRLSPVDQQHLANLFRTTQSYELGKYSKTFTSTWQKVQHEQARLVQHAGWWQRGAPGSSGFSMPSVKFMLFAMVFLVVWGGGTLLAAFGGLIGSPFTAIAVGVIVPLVAAFAMYRTMLPARTATGSALTLRTESFRKFLAASEGKHVEWAWEHGLVREYSAWAVALDAADAWSRAVESSNIPHPEIALGGPLIIYSRGPALQSTRTAPAPSGGSGGGGSFGGGVGGGGGGGSSGSW